jgi:hypothetical protein
MKRNAYKKFLPLFVMFTIAVLIIYYVRNCNKESFQTAFSYQPCPTLQSYRHPERISGNYPVCYPNQIRAPSTDKYFIKVRLFKDVGIYGQDAFFKYFQANSDDNDLGVTILSISRSNDQTLVYPRDRYSKIFGIWVLLLTLNIVDPLIYDPDVVSLASGIQQIYNVNLENNRGSKISRDGVVWGYFKTTPEGREDKNLNNFVPLIPPTWIVGGRRQTATDLSRAFMNNEITDFYILANAPDNAMIKMILNSTRDGVTFKNVKGVAASGWATIPKAKY